MYRIKMNYRGGDAHMGAIIYFLQVFFLHFCSFIYKIIDIYNYFLSF